MELIVQTVKLTQSIAKGETQVMTDGDISIPEIKPEILKLLQVDAVSRIEETQLSEGKLDIRGKIAITLLYIPDREGEKIRSVTEEFDFAYRAENRAIAPGMYAQTNSNVVRVEFSAINSRRVRIKAVTGVEYEVVQLKETDIPIGMDESAQIMTEPIKLRNTVEMSEHEFRIRERTEIAGGQSAINEILKADVRITDTDYKTVSGKIVLKGAAQLSVLYTDSDLEIRFCEAELPFTEVFDAPAADDDTMCETEYAIGEIKTSVGEDSDGERTIINTEIAVKVQIKGEEEAELDMITDCYVPRCRTMLKTSAADIDEYCAAPSMQNTIREIVEFPEGNPPVSGIYNVIARAAVTDARINGNKLLCEGKTEVYILYISDSSDNPVYSLKRELPFSYMLDCEGVPKDAVPRIQAEIRHTSYNLNAAGEAELRCILAINAYIVRKKHISIIEAVETDASKEGGSNIVIYFVQNGDSLWSIAKHYGVAYDEIIHFNKLDAEGAIETGQRLFIP